MQRFAGNAAGASAVLENPVSIGADMRLEDAARERLDNNRSERDECDVQGLSLAVPSGASS